MFMVGTESLSCYNYNDCKKRTLLGKSIAIAPTKSELLGPTDLFSSTSSGKKFTINTHSLRVKHIVYF